MNRLNKTESVIILYCRFTLFLRDPFFQIIYCAIHIQNPYICKYALTYKRSSIVKEIPFIHYFSATFPSVHVLLNKICLYILAQSAL